MDGANVTLSYSGSSLFDFPTELIVHILQFLSLHELITCQLCCRLLRQIIQASSRLQYTMLTEAASIQYGPLSNRPYAERLQLLRRRERAWTELDPRALMTIPVHFQSSGIYDFTGGAFLLGNRYNADNRRLTHGYSYLRLPSIYDIPELLDGGATSITWNSVDFGMTVVDVGLAVEEHDLIAVLTSREVPEDDPEEETMVLELRLLSFSTGHPHPLAASPVMFLTRRDAWLGHCSVLIEIVGDYLAVLLTFPWSRLNGKDKLFLVEWKTGRSHLIRTSQSGAYAHLVFLREDLLVFTHMSLNHLEICKIVAGNPPSLQTVRILRLPSLQNAHVLRFDCRAEPNPMSSSTPPFQPQSEPRTRCAVREDPENAIAIFYLVFQQGPGAPHFGEMHHFSFVIHRRSLIALLPLEAREAPRFHAAWPQADAITVLPLEWEKWGPRVTRWFACDEEPMRWITMTNGQRYVTTTDEQVGPLTLRDFNPYHLRRHQMRAADGGRNADENMVLPNGNVVRLVTEKTVLQRGDLFEADVESELPYCETVTRKEYEYDGVMIDEERIVGLYLREDGTGIKSYDVHLFG